MSPAELILYRVESYRRTKWLTGEKKAKTINRDTNNGSRGMSMSTMIHLSWIGFIYLLSLLHLFACTEE